MNTLLAIVGLGTVVLFGIGVTILKGKLARWLRITLSAPFVAIALFGACLFVGLAWDYYGRPVESTTVSQLQEISKKIDRASIETSLRQKGFSPIVYEEKFTNSGGFKISPAAVAQSASYISIDQYRIRPTDIFASYLVAAFLFDDHQRFITWGYWIYSPSL